MADDWKPSGRLEQLCREQRDGWRLGEKPCVETILERHPEISADHKLLVDLIYAEYMLREEYGESPGVAEYLARFPQLSSEISALFEVLEAIDSEPSLRALDYETGDFSDTDVRPAARPQPAAGDVDSPGPPVPSPAVTPAPAPAPAAAQAAAGLKLGRLFGRYELIEEIARGGMGIVYKARQTKLDRIVALKMILPSHFDSDSAVRRFQIEAEAAAKLDHPCVVPIFDVGEHDGQPYLCMAFIEGESLAARLVAGALPGTEAARIVRDVAEAVHHAHERGIVHRDLKPANILIDPAGRPRVTDFGLARRFDVPTALSLDGTIIGTPSYMSPEQASGRTASIGPSCDIYSLGAVLFHLLTGQPPFKGENVLEIIRQVCEAPPPSARALNASVAPALDAICLKCLAKKPEQRYSTAAELALDLRAFLENAPTAVGIASVPIQSRHPRRTLTLRVAAVVAALIPVLWLTTAMRIPDRREPGAVAPPTKQPDKSASIAKAALGTEVPLTGEISVIVGDGSKNGERRRLRIDQKGALPLRAGDAVRIEVTTNRPAYLYLVWIDENGIALPVYPWQPGHWERRATTDKPTTSLVFPPENPNGDEGGFKNEGSAGMETVVLLARDTPLPAKVALKDLLVGLPSQPLQTGQLMVRLEENERPQGLTRSLDFATVQPIHGGALEMKRQLEARLKPHFRLIRAVSLASRGT